MIDYDEGPEVFQAVRITSHRDQSVDFLLIVESQFRARIYSFSTENKTEERGYDGH